MGTDTITTILPNVHAVIVMGSIVVAFLLFASEKIPLATSSLLVLVFLAVLFEVMPFAVDGGTFRASQLFSGFGHTALITVCALMIAGQGLVRTGALESVGRQLARLWSVSPTLLFLCTLVVAAVLSAFVNNTPVVILLLPILISVSLRTNTSASSLLMPMGFATLIGGMSTTIGTSTNLLVVTVAEDLGVLRFSMFDFLLPAAIAGSVGIVYLWLIAPLLVKNRQPRLTTTSPRVFSAQLHIREEGYADGKTLAEIIEKTGGALEVHELLRGKDSASLVPLPDIKLRAGDRIVVRDTSEQLKEFEDLIGANLFADDVPVDDEHPLTDENQQTAEVVVVPGSTLDGMSLNTARFTARYHLLILALHRADAWKKPPRKEHPAEVDLRPGDVVLVQGSKERIKKIKASRNILVLDAHAELPRSSKAPLALFIMFFIILAAALGLLPIVISSITGVLLLLLTGCIRWRDATRALSAPVILIIVTSLAMGQALLVTGGADYLASVYVSYTYGLQTEFILSGLLLLMAILTNVVSNNAAAVIGTPIAVGIAQQLSLPAEPFVLAVLFGANMSFATPMAYQTNLLVMNAGNYTFSDFLRVGIPLVLLMWMVLSFVLPWLYGI
ncbi:MAG: SLC13 family permease [Gammaproteobacteria bacterium]|nr:SLC13 family permease [Gammaproteobacteria bacterium]